MAEMNPLSDLIDKIEKLKERTLTTLDRDYHEITQYQVEAIGRLMQTIKDLSERSQKLEEINLKLSETITYFTILIAVMAFLGLSVQFVMVLDRPDLLGTYWLLGGVGFLIGFAAKTIRDRLNKK